MINNRVCCGRSINKIPCQLTRSPTYVWRVIKGPAYLIGKMFRRVDVTHGGWEDGEIHYEHIRTHEVLVRHYKIEVVYDH